MNIPYVMRQCNMCGEWLVASTVNFYGNKGGKYGLSSICKECRAKYNKQHRKVKEREKSLNMKLTRTKDSYRKVGDKWLLVKKCTCCGKWLVASTVNFHRAKKGLYELEGQCKECRNKKNEQYYEDNKEKIAEHRKQYRQDNKEKILKQKKQYRDNNKEKEAERHKQYYEANKEKVLERQKQYRENNKDKVLEQCKRYRQSLQGQVVAFNARNKRRHKKEAQGTGVTPDQWLEMMQYFDWRCAYTGERLTDKTRSGDHIVAIDAGGDDMVWNMVPMLRNLNSSKQAKDMLEWYKSKDFFSETRLAKIYEWQEYARKKWKK